MQSAATARDQILQGIEAGVYYYLTKPYEDRMLLAIVGAALRDASTKKKLRREVNQHRHVIGLMEQSRFRFRTPEEARNLAFLIANCFPDPEAAVYGLNEMLINAVEHGNLGITYDEKTRLILEGNLQEEIERRLESPEYGDKWARLSFEAGERCLRVRIKDEGAGFDWRQYLDISPERATHPSRPGNCDIEAAVLYVGRIRWMRKRRHLHRGYSKPRRFEPAQIALLILAAKARYRRIRRVWIGLVGAELIGAERLLADAA